MNFSWEEFSKKANTEIIYNIYLYLSHRTAYYSSQTLKSAVAGLEKAFLKGKPELWKIRDIKKLNILKASVKNNMIIANSKINNLTYSKKGLTACTFTRPDGSISVAFKGTGKGEWIDNGEGLSGIPEENTYMYYGKEGRLIKKDSVITDYATDQQVEALNWFRRIVAQNNWDKKNRITLSGHSKGGNKAQFVAVHSGFFDTCISFDGQGFSPEALNSFKVRLGEIYEKRRQLIYSISSENDYVNVLGLRLMPETNIFYVSSDFGLHFPEAMLDSTGKFNPLCNQGKLSSYIEDISDKLMNMKPELRKYATLGIMNIFQKYLGEGNPVNGDRVSLEVTAAGIAVAIGSLFSKLESND